MNADGAAGTSDDVLIAEEFYPNSFGHRREVFETLDPHFAANWVSHQARLFSRPWLDKRKRFLVLAGQYTMRGDRDALEETLSAAVAAGVDPHELLEAVLQCYVYAGGAKVAAAGLPLDGGGRPIITHCQGGGRASVAAFALERAGVPARNYYPGWSEWGNAADAPIETGEPRPKK